MNLISDENFPLETTFLLRDAGYDVLAIGTDFAGVADEEVMEVAINTNRLILTFDRDFGDLIFRKGLKPTEGVLYFRFKDMPTPKDLFYIVIALLQDPNLNFEQCLTVVTPTQVRQRKY